MSIEAMKLALEVLETAFVKPSKKWKAEDKAITALRAAIEQAEKPMAWMYDWWDESEDLDGVPTGGEICDCITKDYDEAHSPTMGCHNIRPLYTAPPQRSWQGLTFEEQAILVFKYWDKPAEFIFSVEAKLKEKNT